MREGPSSLTDSRDRSVCSQDPSQHPHGAMAWEQEAANPAQADSSKVVPPSLLQEAPSREEERLPWSSASLCMGPAIWSPSRLPASQMVLSPGKPQRRRGSQDPGDQAPPDCHSSSCHPLLGQILTPRCAPLCSDSSHFRLQIPLPRAFPSSILGHLPLLPLSHLLQEALPARPPRYMLKPRCLHPLQGPASTPLCV